MSLVHGEAFYPHALADLYTDEGVANRQVYNRHLWGFVDRHRQRALAPGEKTYIDALDAMPAGNMLVPPHDFLATVTAPFDLIAVSFVYRTEAGISKSVALMEQYSPQSPVQEGTGKTGLVLALLGIAVPYDELPRPQSRDNPDDAYQAIEALEAAPLTPLLHRNRNVRVISTDLLYIGIDCQGKLALAGAVGEPCIAQWDMARHISRAFDAYYKDRTGKTIPWLREYMHALAEKCYLPFGHDG